VKPLRVGTRGSALALWQAHYVADHLKRLDGIEAELILVRTSGDRLQSAPAEQVNEQIGSEAGLKGLFIKELEEALLAGTIDLAVHSVKDVPTELPPGLRLAAITRRGDPRDCLISRQGSTLKTLPNGSRIGTSSLRRQAQLRHHRPDLDVVDLRGNVDTRLKKVESGELDSVVLAVAGVNRLGLAHKVTQVFDEDVMLPAVGQGALGIETRADDRPTFERVVALTDAETTACVTAERALLEALQGGCQVPLGALGSLRGGELHLEAAVFSAAGSEYVRCSENGPAEQAREIGLRLAAALIESGAEKLLRLAGRTVGQL
jgi:hydroxymethylbilane synthase